MAAWLSLGISGVTLLGAILLWFWKGASSWSWVKRSIRSYLDGTEALRQMVFQMYGALEKGNLVTGECRQEIMKAWSDAGFVKPFQELRDAVGKGNPMTSEQLDRLSQFVDKARSENPAFSEAEAVEFRDLAQQFLKEVKEFAGGQVKDDSKAISYVETAMKIADISAYIYGKTKKTVPS